MDTRGTPDDRCRDAGADADAFLSHGLRWLKLQRAEPCIEHLAGRHPLRSTA
jgi:hypothetical protein